MFPGNSAGGIQMNTLRPSRQRAYIKNQTFISTANNVCLPPIEISQLQVFQGAFIEAPHLIVILLSPPFNCLNGYRVDSEHISMGYHQVFNEISSQIVIFLHRSMGLVQRMYVNEISQRSPIPSVKKYFSTRQCWNTIIWNSSIRNTRAATRSVQLYYYTIILLYYYLKLFNTKH